VIQRVHPISLAAPIAVLVLIGLIAVGIGQIVTPLLLGYAIAVTYVVLEIKEGRAPIPTHATPRESSNKPLSSPRCR